MRVMQVSKPGGPFESVDRPIPQPGAGEVRIKVKACGVCHSDAFVKEGTYPGIEYPRTPGHEVVGDIDAIGTGVTAWKAGDRVGVGWHGGHCGQCMQCRRGDFILCEEGKVTGISFDGGYQEYMLAPVSALARLPADLDPVVAAPLLCAGITTYNALRHSGARPGELVAIQGIGGLGHLAVQFARAMGFNTVAISRGADKADLAKKLGAHQYIDAAAGDPAKSLRKLGGARVILATAPNSDAITALMGGLGVDGCMLVVGVDAGQIKVSPFVLVGARRSIRGWPSGHAADSEDTVNFSVQAGIRAMVETFPLSRAQEAYERMMGNHARFRVVLIPD
jgi:alcohol dehydrogenase/propanol-preferring alcohol dehydrogenase